MLQNIFRYSFKFQQVGLEQIISQSVTYTGSFGWHWRGMGCVPLEGKGMTDWNECCSSEKHD